jgi:ketosteroid isomerase-like protein
MSQELVERARVGLESWRRGDFASLERMLAPEVELLWWDPGDWDCHGRDEVMQLLRERYEQGFAGGRMELVEAGEDRLIMVDYPAEVGGPEWPEETATVITFRDGKAIHMQQYPTREEALRALGES